MFIFIFYSFYCYYYCFPFQKIGAVNWSYHIGDICTLNQLQNITTMILIYIYIFSGEYHQARSNKFWFPFLIVCSKWHTCSILTCIAFACHFSSQNHVFNLSLHILQMIWSIENLQHFVCFRRILPVYSVIHRHI